MKKSLLLILSFAFAISINAESEGEQAVVDINPAAYTDEPTAKSDINERGTILRYKPFGYTMYDIIIYTESGAAVWLNLYTTKVFPTGTFPINDQHTTNTVLASVGYSQPSFYQTTEHYWYLRSGNVSISPKGTQWVFEVDAYTYNGSHIHVDYEGTAEYVGTYTTDPEFTYDGEPEQKSSLRYTFNKCEYHSHNGILAIDMQNDTTQMYIEMVSAENEPPSGIYYIATDSVPGTLIYSPGGTEKADYGTFLAEFDKQENWLRSYYMTSGTLSVKRENGLLTMMFAGRSKKGSDVTVIYTSPISSDIEQIAPAESINYKRYNILGQEVDEYYRGVVIENKRKMLVIR